MVDRKDLGYKGDIGLMVSSSVAEAVAVGIKPTGDRVLVLQDREPEKIGGVILADSPYRDYADPQTGRVCGMGRDFPFADTLSLGDRVLFDCWHGEEFEFEGRSLRLLDGDEILAFVDGSVTD